MTAGDFIPPDQEFESAPNYPTAFGVTFTPMVTGITCGVLGLLGAIYLWFTLGQPEVDKYSNLSSTVEKKEQELKSQQEIEKKLKDAKKRLAETQQQREQVLSLFAKQKDLNTLLFDLNQLIEKNNAGLLGKRQQKLNVCPPSIREQYTNLETTQSFEDTFGPLVAEAKLKSFKPVDETTTSGSTATTAVPGVVTDGSLGKELDNKLKRQTVEIVFEGNFAQTQSIFRTIERLQPFLIFKNMQVVRGRGGQTNPTLGIGIYNITPEGLPQFITNCQPDAVLTTSFQMDALIPLTEEETKKLQPTPSPGASPSPQ
ncbi:MAG: hypothetical protein VKJ24_07285 [Synechococcales bacterium]|nr:hypothetical protein [Synechococcales bacterium]